MKRIFLIGALTLTTVGALTALLVVQAKDKSVSQKASADIQPSKSSEEAAFVYAQSHAESQTKVFQNPNYDPAKDPFTPGDDRLKAARELLHKGELDAAERNCREAIKIFRGATEPISPKSCWAIFNWPKANTSPPWKITEWRVLTVPATSYRSISLCAIFDWVITRVPKNSTRTGIYYATVA